MKEVSLTAFVPSQSAETVYTTLSNFSAYPDLCESIRKIDIQPMEHNETLSDWEVDFHSGVLRWQELDVFDPINLIICFRQTTGDIEHFSGSWQICDVEQGASIAFRSRFDIGLPMLADMLDPIAWQALRDNIGGIIHGLFPNSLIRD